MHCIETLAHVDMLCLDKTGTITEGKMRVSEVHIFDESMMPISAEQAIRCFVGAMEDNNATFMALKEHFPADYAYHPVVKTPFSSQRKWSGATFENIGTIIIGAPEILSASVFPDSIEKAQQAGERVLCLGYCPEPIKDDILPSARLVAAICLSDPIRKEAKETLAFFKQEGVAVKIISGDNPLTVSNIARQAGLDHFDSYIDLSDVDTEDEIRKAASKYSVFGRVTPNQKSQLVKALQAEGHTVAMTGNGVNDVLALREADCSIAMAAGSDAARQVSQVILLNSDFSALPEVVMEGRRVVNNIFLTISWLSPAIGISASEAKTVLYYATGFISLFALVKSCLPFNKLRVFLCAASAAGFYLAAYLFAGILMLEPITAAAFIFFAVLAALCILLERLLARCAEKVYNKKAKDKNRVTYGQI